MVKIFFTQEEYENIPNNLKNRQDVVLTQYANGYSLKTQGELEEKYYYIYPVEGTDTGGNKKLVNAFRTPLAGILSVTPLNNIANGITGMVASNSITAAGCTTVSLNCGLIVCLAGSALCLPKFLTKSSPSNSRYGIDMVRVDNSKKDIDINLNDLVNTKTVNLLAMEQDINECSNLSYTSNMQMSQSNIQKNRTSQPKKAEFKEYYQESRF